MQVVFGALHIQEV